MEAMIRACEVLGIEKDQLGYFLFGNNFEGSRVTDKNSLSSNI
jgi:hypothetical protein